MRLQRRSFLAGLGAAAATVPFAARAQERLPVVAWFTGSTLGAATPRLLAALESLGYIADRDFTFVGRWQDDDPDDPRLPPLTDRDARHAALVAELVALEPDILVVTGNLKLRAMAAATATIPIVSNAPEATFLDLVGPNFALPPGNVTGATNRLSDMPAKLAEVLADAFPDARRIGYLEPDLIDLDQIAAAASALSRELVPVDIRLDSPFEEFARLGLDAIVAGPSITHELGRKVIAWAAAEKIPVIYTWQTMVEAGGIDELHR